MIGLVLLALSGPAEAQCSCLSVADGVVGGLPARNDIGVPLNARVSLLVLDSVVAIEPRLLLNGEPVEAELELVEAGRYTRYDLVPVGGLAPFQTYEWTYAVEDSVPDSGIFTTGDQVDTSPPTFERIEVTSTKDSNPCGRSRLHDFQPVAVRGEYFMDRTWTLVEPVDPSFRAVLFPGRTVVWAQETCGALDDTLFDNFHRTYRVTITDVAGNSAPPVIITTDGKGVSVSPSGEVLDIVGCQIGPRSRRTLMASLWSRRR